MRLRGNKGPTLICDEGVGQLWHVDQPHVENVGLYS